jgi:hypothetical protein
MEWKMVVAVIVAVGSLAATAARAQDNAAGTGATATEGQTATSDPAAYGSYVEEPATVDADGVPVAKPNPMSDFLERSRQFDTMPIEMPLVDGPRTDGPATDGQTN